MVIKRMTTSKEEEMIKGLEDIIERIKRGEVESCEVRAVACKSAEDYNTGSDTRPDNEEEKVALSPEQKLLKAIFDDDKSREMPCEECKYGKIMDKTKTTIITLLEQCLAVPVCLVHDYNNAFKNCTEFDCDTEDVDQDS